MSIKIEIYLLYQVFESLFSRMSANSTTHDYNVILTYESEEQEIFDLTIQAGLDEKTFVFEIISEASHPSQLVKISTCMMRVEEAGKIRACEPRDMPSYMVPRFGKYYFTDEDEDTRAWKGFRDAFVLRQAKNKLKSSEAKSAP